MSESILFSNDTFAYQSRGRLSALQKPPPPFQIRYIKVPLTAVPAVSSQQSAVSSQHKTDTMKMVKTLFTVLSVCSLCLAFVSVNADDGNDYEWAVGTPLIHINRIDIDSK